MTSKAAAFIGARVFVDKGQYYTDCTVVYELIELARHFDEFSLHCFVIHGKPARDGFQPPPSLRLVDIGNVSSGWDLYGHPIRLWRRVWDCVRQGDWGPAVLVDPGPTSLLGLAACWLTRRPALGMLRGEPAAGWLVYRHSRGAGAMVGFLLQRFRAFVQWALAATVCVVTDSDTVHNRLRQRGACVHHVPGASISEADVLPASEPWRGAGNGPMRLLFVGRLELQKDLETLLDAVHAASQAGRVLRLQIVGPGDPRYTALLRTRARDLGLEASVEFSGALPHGPQLYSCYQQAHALVMSSRSEGIPKVVIEAMAHGLPVVATAVGGLPRLVTPDVGILVPPQDSTALSKALITLHDSPSMAAAMSEAARKVSASLLAEPVSRELASLVGESARPPRLRLLVLLGGRSTPAGGAEVRA